MGDEESNGLCRIIMLVCPCLFALIVLILFSILFGYQNSENAIKKRDSVAAMKNLEILYNKPLLSSLSLVDPKQNCPAGSTKQKLGDFGGVVSTCVCKDGSTHNYAYCAFTSNCEYQSSTNPINEFVWDGNNVCGVTMDMSKVKEKPAGGKCETGYKECPYRICSKQPNADKTKAKDVNSNVCPMTKVIYTAAKTDPTTKKVTPASFTLDDAVQKGESYGPIVTFSAVESKDSKSCLLPQYYIPVTASKKNYPAFRIPQNGCGTYGPRVGEVKITDIASATYEKDN